MRTFRATISVIKISKPPDQGPHGMDGNQRKKVRSPRRGITLIELLGVMLIIGMVAATVAIRVSSLTHQSRLEWGLGQLIHADAAMRSHARNHGRNTALELELGSGLVTRHWGTNTSETKTESLGDRVTIRRFVSPTQDTSVGRVAVNYSGVGVSPTYALELEGPQKQQQAVWLVFVGATGRCERVLEERNVVPLVKQFAATGAHAR